VIERPRLSSDLRVVRVTPLLGCGRPTDATVVLGVVPEVAVAVVAHSNGAVKYPSSQSDPGLVVGQVVVLVWQTSRGGGVE
jgi:hypothetical protein